MPHKPTVRGKLSFLALLKQELVKAETIDDNGQLLNKAEAIAGRLIKLALGDDKRIALTAIQMILDRIEGRTASARDTGVELLSADQARDQIRRMAESSIEVRKVLQSAVTVES
jgi:hypothetical protein